MQRTKLPAVVAITVLASVGTAAAQSSGAPPGMAAMPPVTCSASQAGVGFVCGPRDVEDIVLIPGSEWLIAGETGIIKPPGSLVAINTRTKTWRRIFPNDKSTAGDSGPDCKAAPDPKKFNVIGLGIANPRGGSMRLYATERLRRAVEIFDLRMTATGPEVTWNSCVPLPQGKTANSVLALPEGRFAVSTFLEDGFEFPDLRRGVNTGRVLIWTPGQGFNELPGSFSPAPNGLALGPDGAHLFVGATGAKTVLKIALDGRGVLERIALEFGPDNLHSASDGSILVAGRAPEAACGDIPPAQPNPMCARGVAVVRINPATGAVQSVVRTVPNPNFVGGSAAFQVGEEIWLTAVPSAGVGYVKAK